MRKQIIPQDMRVGTLHLSNNHGNFLITCYVSSSKVYIYFLETGNEEIKRSGEIRSGFVKDSKSVKYYSNGGLTQKSLKRIISYNKNTGIFIKNRGFSPRAKIGSECGTLLNNGYISIYIAGKNRQAHRLAWLYMTGEWPNEIDHINGIKTDNRIDNLRDVMRSENLRNQPIKINNKSGVIGVYWHVKEEVWHCQIGVNSSKKWLGRFNNFNDAVIARKMAESEYGFHANHGRKN